MGKTCVPCRARKVKCDGGQPQCTPCLKYRRTINCTYERSPWDKGTLCKREACLSCRRSKRRCDARRPSCSTCQNSRREGGCIYESTSSGRRRYQRDSAGNLHEIKSARHSRSLDRSRASPSGELTTPSPVTVVTLSSSSDSSPDICANSFFRNSSRPPRRTRCGAFKSTFNLSSLPPLKLEDIDDPFAFALSDVSLDDLNMKFRMLFLYSRILFGIYLPYVKRQAIFLGDTSAAVIHPFFVHYANLAGCQLYQERQGYFGLLHIQAVHLQSTLEAMKTMKEEDDPLALAIAYYYMGMAHGYVQNVQPSINCVKRSVDIVRRNKIRFVAISTGDASQEESNVLCSVPGFSEEVHERAAFLAQMLYSEMFFFLAVQPEGGVFYFEDRVKPALPTLYSDIYVGFVGGQPEEGSFGLEMQFRKLPDTYPTLFKTCPMMLRAHSIILAKDGRNLIAWFHQDDTPSVLWFPTCSIFLSHLTAHIKSIDTQIITSTDARDRESCWCLRYCMLVSLTTLAQISHTLAKHPSTATTTEFAEERNEALRRVVAVIEELTPDEFQFLDPFLGVHWNRTLEILANRKPITSSAATPRTPSPPANALVAARSPDSSNVTTDSSSTFTTTASDLETNIQLISQLNDKFIQNRFLPGTPSLCEKLAAQNVERRHNSTRHKI